MSETRYTHKAPSLKREAMRFTSLVGTLAAIGGFAIGKATNNDVACYVSDPNSLKFYEGDTALEAAAKVPGVDNLDLRDIPMSASSDGELVPAASIHNVSSGLYGPDNCSQAD